MNRSIKIKDLLIKWKEELIKNLKNPKLDQTINLYLIPLKWKDVDILYIDKNLEDEIDIFNNKISKDKGKSIIPSSDFLIIKESYITKKIPSIKREATYATNKLVVDLKNNNYYFYYLDNKDNICEGYVEAIRGIDDDFIEEFNNNPIDEFIASFLKNKKSKKSNNLIIYDLSYCKFVIKKENLIDNDKSIKINNYLTMGKNKWRSKFKTENKINNNDINDKNKENENEIVKCLIYYYYSDLQLNHLKKNIIDESDEFVEFFPINSEWISLFKEKCNYEKNKNIIKSKKIDLDNYLDNMHYLKDINFEGLEDFKIFPLDNYDKINNIYVQIYKNYELINSDTYNILVKFFGKKDRKSIKSLEVIKLDTKYILIKYDSKTFEIVKINDEKKRYVIKGKKNLDDNIIKELLNSEFNDWLKNLNIDINNFSNEELLIEKKVVANILSLEKIENFSEIIEDGEKNNQIKFRKIIYNFRKFNLDKDKIKEKSNKEKLKDYKNIEEERKEQEGSNDKIVENPEGTVSGLIGLQNIGATCYMNAALQCLSNVERLRMYFLNNNLKINSKKNPLSTSLLKVFQNLWENKKITYFVPTDFKNTISRMNPLFDGIQANDTKDLILFILETVHNELNEIKGTENNNNNINFNNYDFNLVFQNFGIYFKNHYNSIVSTLFYGMTNSMMTCCSCGITTHNVQCFSILFFPLEEVRKFKGYSQNIVNIFDCFDFNQKQDCMMGQNQIYCNGCHQNSNAITQSRIIVSPNVLVINLNRGKGLMYDIKILFEEFLELKNYVYFEESPHFYELIGVVTHLGSSDMSGHFIAFCKNSENFKWYKYNDAIVTESSFQEVANFGVPYVLFYRIMRKS